MASVTFVREFIAHKNVVLFTIQMENEKNSLDIIAVPYKHNAILNKLTPRAYKDTIYLPINHNGLGKLCTTDFYRETRSKFVWQGKYLSAKKEKSLRSKQTYSLR